MPRIVAGAGLLLVLAVLLDPGSGLAPDLPSLRVTFTVPQALLMATGFVFALAWLVILVAARARRKPDDEPESRLRTSWRQAFAPIVALLPVIAVVVVLWHDGGRLVGALLALGSGWFGASGGTAPGAEESLEISLPWLGWGVGLLLLAVALATLAVALLLLFGERLITWWLERRAQAERAELVAAVDDSLDDLADGGDARVAIISCYRRFEQAAARARVRRAPWQTAGEFMREALARLALPDAAVERLTRLFELARFSHHPLRAAERDDARACLEEIRAALDRTDDPIVVA